MNKPKIATSIVDKNGKNTTVHKNADATKAPARKVPDVPKSGIDQTSDIARLIPGNPVEAASKTGAVLDKKQSSLVTGFSAVSSVEVYGERGEAMVTTTFNGVNLGRIIASEIDVNPSDDDASEALVNVSDRLDELEEALASYGIEVDDLSADVQTWSYTFPLDESDEVDSWSGVAEQIDAEGGVAILNDFITLEPESSLHDIVWEALSL